MKLTVTTSPHIRSSFRTNRIMLDVVLALIPALAVGVYVQGSRALLVTAASMVCAVGFEVLWCMLTRSTNTATDGSAFVTGLLLALTLPVSVPLWQVALGNLFAIVFVKKLFGGLGQNIFNPALAARAFMMLVYPVGLTRYSGMDGVTSATPLHHMVMPALPDESLLDMFLGRCPGSIGEISVLALIAGGIYLVVRKVISLRIPLSYVGTLAVLSLVFSKTDSAFFWMGYSVLSGGLLLGAVFMATDYATSPVTVKGQILYGIGCGVLTLLLRYFGLFPEGVTYAILIMNAFVWAIDRYTGPVRFGKVKGGSSK